METTTDNNIWWVYAGDVGDIKIERQTHNTSCCQTSVTLATVCSDASVEPTAEATASAEATRSFRNFSPVKFVSELASSGVDAALSAIGFVESRTKGALLGYLKYVEGLIEDLDYIDDTDQKALDKIKDAIRDLGQ